MIGAMAHTQRGMSIWQWLAVLATAGFFLTIAAKLGPLYITNFAVQSTITDLRTDRELIAKSVVEIRGAIEKKFDVNRIEVVQAVCRIKELPCLKIEKTKDALLINGNYEARVPVMGNVDAVVKFDKNYIEIPLRGGS